MIDRITKIGLIFSLCAPLSTGWLMHQFNIGKNPMDTIVGDALFSSLFIIGFAVSSILILIGIGRSKPFSVKESAIVALIDVVIKIVAESLFLLRLDGFVISVYRLIPFYIVIYGIVILIKCKRGKMT